MYLARHCKRQIFNKQYANVVIASMRLYDSDEKSQINKEGGKEDKQTESTKSCSDEIIDDLEAPTTCCMSGCANCVWIEYAEKLSSAMKNSDAEIQRIIMEKIEDPNMRAFLTMELRYRNLIK